MTEYSLEECSPEVYRTASTLQNTAAQAEPVSFLQSPFYGAMQTKSGKEVVYFLIKSADKTVGFGLAVLYVAPGGLTFLYCPYGPVCETWSDALLDELRDFLQPIAVRFGCAFVRLDTDALLEQTSAKPIAAKLAKTASLQPRAEWVLDISSAEEEIWAGLHKHARYNVRLAERANAQVVAHKPSEAPLDDFYALMQTTADRDGFGIFDRSYYEAYLSALSDDEGFVIICSIDGKPAAAGLFVTYDKQTHYVFAGSSNDFRKIAPAYAVIWAAIKESQHRGSILFNFGGIRDDVKGQDLGGVTSFKKRFGGYAIAHKNPYDLVYKLLPYLLFRLYKTLR